MPLAMSTDTEMVHTAFIGQSGFSPSFPLGKYLFVCYYKLYKLNKKGKKK